MPSSLRTHAGHSERRPSASRRSSARLDDLDDQPSPGKRPKLQHTPDRPRNHVVSRASGSENMYSFQSNVIDLTSSPPRRLGASPQQQRPSNGTKPVGTSNTPSGAKKLVVKNLKQPPKHDPEKYLNQVWAQVDSALITIFSDDTEKYSLEELYRGVENVCRQNWAAELSKRLRGRCTDHIISVVKPRTLQSKSAEPGQILAKVVNEWLRWRKQNVRRVSTSHTH
jgi:Cullin family